MVVILVWTQVKNYMRALAHVDEQRRVASVYRRELQLYAVEMWVRALHEF